MRAPARFLLLILAVLAAAPAMAGEQMVLNRGSASEPDTLDPHKSSGNTAAVIFHDIFLGLMTADAKGEIIYGAAESHTVSDDGLLYTFKLRPGLKWSDGVDFTAEDFVYSLRRVQDPATAGRYGQWLWAIENAEAISQGKLPTDQLGVRAIDPLTLEIKLHVPSPILLETMFSMAAYPVPRHVIEKFGDAWTAPGNMVSNGPYMLTERVPQTRVTVVKNPNFYDAANVKIDVVNYFPTDNMGTVLNRFRAGELDAVLNFPPEQIDWLKENMPNELRISPNLGVYYFLINNDKPPFNDARVRRALSMVIDREGMITRLFNTGVTPAYSLVSPVVENYQVYRADFADMPMPARVTEAKRLLAEAGFTPENPLKLTLQFDTLEESRRMAVTLGAMWRPLGVQAELVNSEFRDLIRRSRTGDYDVMRWAYFSPLADASAYLNMFRSFDVSNYTKLNSPAFDALMAAANSTPDMAKRAADMQAAEKILIDDSVIIPIYHYAGRRLIHTYVKNWIDNPRNVNMARYLTVEKAPGGM